MNFIINKEEFLKIKAAWPKITNRTASDHIFYNAFRGHDLKRGFAETTSPNKLQNGSSPWQAFEAAKREALGLIGLYPTYSHDTPARVAQRAAATAARIKWLSDKFGIEFSAELQATLRELFK